MTELITVNEHSSIRIGGDRVIYCDPFRIRAAAHDADIILITHEHYDHFSPEDIARVRRSDTRFVLPESMKGCIGKAGIAPENVCFLKPGGSAEVLGVKIEAVAAYNVLKPFHPKHKDWLGYIVNTAGSRVYICGDTDDTKEARAVSCDVVLLPIGGTYTMNAKNAAALANALAPVTAVPVHYGTVAGKPEDADEFERNVTSGVKVVRKLSF